MTIGEHEFMTKVPYWLMEAAKQLKKMNQLKALEMKMNYDVVKQKGGVSLEYDQAIDDIMEGKDK